MTWRLLAPLLLASTAAAQPLLPARLRQDRRASLPSSPTEPLPELFVAAGNLTTLAFNATLDRDSLVLDRTRFKWLDVGDRLLALAPFADLGPGERLILQVSFKDKALPAKAIIALVSKADVMDGMVEVDRRANSPEALLAALSQKEAELAELKARSAGTGPMGLMLSGWLTENSRIIPLRMEHSAAEGRGLEVAEAFACQGTSSTVVAFQLRNLPGQKPWALEQTRVLGPRGAPVKLLSVQMKQVQLEPGEGGLVVVELEEPPWEPGKPFSVVLTETGGAHRLSINLKTK